MKIRKFAGGGFNYIPIERGAGEVAGASSPASSSSSEESSKVPGFAKEVIDIIQTNGLQSDVDKFLTQWENTLDLAMDPTGKNLSMKEILQMQRYAQQVKNCKESFDKAKDNLIKEDAWGEIATNEKGQLYVWDGKDVKTVSASDYSEKKDKYNLLTNQDLMQLRENSGKYGYDTELIANLQNAVGMNSVVDQVLKLIKDFGSNEETGYASKKGNEIRRGIEKLMGVGPDGMYKVTTKRQIEGDADLAAAVNYLYKALPKSYQNALRAKTAGEGGNPGTMDELSLLAQMVQRNVSFEAKVDYDKTASAEHASGSGSGSGSTATKTMQLGEAYQTGSGWGEEKMVNLGTSTDGIRLNVASRSMGQVMSGDDKILGDASLNDTLIMGKQLAGHLDLGGATFGDIPIEGEIDMSKIMVDSTAGLQRAWLPVKRVNGRETVNFELYDAIEAINKNIKPGMTAGQIQQMLRNTPELEYNQQTGKVEVRRQFMKPFMVMAGVVSDDVWDAPLKKSKWLHRVGNDEDRRLKNHYNDVVGTMKNTGEKASKTGNKADWLGGYKFYRGGIYIPVLDGTQSTPLYNGQEFAKTDYMNTDARYAARQAYMAQGMVRDALEEQGYQFNLKS